MAFRLHSRLLAFNVAAIGIGILLLGYFLAGAIRTSFETEKENQLSTSATLARAYIGMHSGDRTPVELAEELSELLQMHVTIIAADGRIVGDSAMTLQSVVSAANVSDRPEVIDALKTGHGVSIRRALNAAAPFIYVATKLDDGSVLRLAAPLEMQEALIGGLRRQLLLATLIAIGVTLIFSYMVYAAVSRPLRLMAQASHDIAAGSVNSELPEIGDRDLAVVASSLNAMAKTLQRKMEELQDDKQRTAAIIAAMSAGVVVFNREARVVLANRWIRRLLDMQGEPAGKMPLELVRHASIEAAIRDALGGTDVAPIDITTNAGKVLLAKAAPIRALSGRVELVVVVFHDLTEIRRVERMRKDFIANVSHEFKTPLTSIRGYAETLLNAAPRDPQLTREFLETIERNGALLQALVDDLLVLSRLESELPVEKQQLNLRELVEREIQLRRHLLHEKDIRVHVECPPIQVLADSSRLGRAVSNLFDNAIHYNRTGGEVRVTARVAGRQLVLEIADTGVGIPHEDLARIFERFYRVEKSRARESGGTGLGLAIAKHAVESQGGTISVVSKVGAGSAFTIYLPVAHEPAAATSA